MSKVIYNDTVIAVTLITGSAQSGYPLENLRNNHPRKPFKSNEQTVTIRVDEGGAADALAIVFTNASSISISSMVDDIYSWGESDDGSTITEGEDEEGSPLTLVDDSDTVETWSQSYDNWDGETGILLMEFEPIYFSRAFDITLTSSAGDVVSIGLITAGQTLLFRDFEHESYQCTSDDRGTEVELNDGSFYYNPAGVLMKPSGRIVMWDGSGPDPVGYDSYIDFYRYVWAEHGKSPMVWKMARDDRKLTIYAGLNDPPIAVKHGLNHVLVGISLKERM